MERTRVAIAPFVDLADLPLPAVLQINAVADEFEAIWHSGERPRIEDFLGGTDQLQHDALSTKAGSPIHWATFRSTGPRRPMQSLVPKNR